MSAEPNTTSVVDAVTTTNIEEGAASSSQIISTNKQIKSVFKRDDTISCVKPSTVKVHLYEGKDLINADTSLWSSTDLSDPYCEITIEKQTKTSTRLENTLNPLWNETFEFIVDDITAEEILVIFKLYDHNRAFKDRKMGYAAVSLSVLYLIQGDTFDMELKLQGVPKGSIKVGITAVDFNIKTGFVKEGEQSLGIPQAKLENFLDDYTDERGTVTSFDHRGRSLKSIATGTITTEESQRLDRLFGVVYLEELYDQLRTGDIILSSGREAFSKAIQLAYASTWSHISFVLRNPSEQVLKKYGLWTDAASDRESVYIVESDTSNLDGKLGGGSQLVGLRQWVNNVMNGSVNDILVVRQLQLPQYPIRPIDESNEERFPELDEHLIKIRDAIYETSRKQLVSVVFKSNETNDESELFCSELVATCFVSMGLLPKGTLTNNYGPKDFSSESNAVNTALLKGANFTKEVRVRVKSIDEKVGYVVGTSI
ncbi:C2 domain-containing protein [Naegleria gruberi]|uniref:C2 domain-containing protein n=1 Tax=Naegleria gruberi TaxID=5762 RepID=D2VKW2_NAEGR|nr:C2 domain-containing protein [Naegleria gruberi]EFC42513.1 C2 domain-containing protein [Naegleria gruberi]|eukprot:XP_002675257.1 C2 domain-containing protein [Naegleria gruberi strain NEG-M]